MQGLVSKGLAVIIAVMMCASVVVVSANSVATVDSIMAKNLEVKTGVLLAWASNSVGLSYEYAVKVATNKGIEIYSFSSRAKFHVDGEERGFTILDTPGASSYLMSIFGTPGQVRVVKFLLNSTDKINEMAVYTQLDDKIVNGLKYNGVTFNQGQTPVFNKKIVAGAFLDLNDGTVYDFANFKENYTYAFRVFSDAYGVPLIAFVEGFSSARPITILKANAIMRANLSPDSNNISIEMLLLGNLDTTDYFVKPEIELKHKGNIISYDKDKVYFYYNENTNFTEYFISIEDLPSDINPSIVEVHFVKVSNHDEAVEVVSDTWIIGETYENYQLNSYINNIRIDDTAGKTLMDGVVQNNTEAEKTFDLCIGVYQNDRLCSILMRSVTLAPGTSKTIAEIEISGAAEEGTVYKLLVWDTQMTPMAESEIAVYEKQ